MTGLCAHCVRERDDLAWEDFDGRAVRMCWECREGEIGGYRFIASSPAERANAFSDNKRAACFTGRGNE